jgi:hypothetical protein
MRKQGAGELAAGPTEIRRISDVRVRPGGEQHKP